jgi:hypothetical protein
MTKTPRDSVVDERVGISLQKRGYSSSFPLFFCPVANTSQMYLISKHFSQIFAPESHRTWIKTDESGTVFSKVSFLSVFTGNKIEKK